MVRVAVSKLLTFGLNERPKEELELLNSQNKYWDAKFL